jgi:DUF1680 family protein
LSDFPNAPHAIHLKDVDIVSGLWGERQAVIRDKTIPAIYRQLGESGRLIAWTLDPNREPPKRRKVLQMFWDSDSAKWLEAVGHSLSIHPDPALEQQADDLIHQIERAQQPDGYLNTYFTVLEPENRWRNLRDWHEMYNAGHLIEAAVAYFQATGNRTLMDVMVRNVELIASLFGRDEGKKRGYCGHPEIELALVKLYRLTGEKRYLDLSRYFVEERGQSPHYFDIEARERGENPEDFWAQTYRYCQAHMPVREQTKATGHAVRAGYLYSAVADIALETDDPALRELMCRLWDDLTRHQMYITGGLGPARSNEGFTFDYDLPNETAYAETCASISLVLWAQRMFHLDPNGRYIDVMERALYNTVLSGVSIEGDHFFYANPLASYPNVNPYESFSGITSAHYYRRAPWFDCPCCPPNLARLVSSLGSYFYSVAPGRLYVHLYNANRARVSVAGTEVQLEQRTNYPWDGDISLSVQVEQPVEFELALRIPGWCRDFRLMVNGTPADARPENGYVVLRRTWASGDEISLSLAMPVERMAPHPNIRENAGCIALQRGPVVYCLEEVDNGPRLANLVLPRDAQLNVEFDGGLLGGAALITGIALRDEPADFGDELYQPRSALIDSRSPVQFKAIPYYLWANREPGEMRVWVRED